MDDGLIKLRVEKITTNNKTLHCQVIEGGLLSKYIKTKPDIDAINRDRMMIMMNSVLILTPVSGLFI